MRCPRCRAENSDDRRACSACGSALAGERRQLTVLFCDLVGSTALAGRLDPEDLRDVVRAYQETAAVIIARHEGHVAQYLGDGLLIYFGFPKPHEDDPARAVRAGLEIVGAVGALAVPRLTLPEPLRVRVGIHTGLVVVGDVGAGDRHEELALGETPNVAARLQSIAEPNAVVISDATQRLTEGLFDGEALGEQSLKGVARAVAAHRVRAARGVGSRFEVSLRRGLTPLVGRRAELDTLLESWRAARAGVRVVNVVGEAGIGKSRLLHEFAERVSGEEAFFLRGHCSSEGRSTPFLPFVEVVRTSFRIGDGDARPEEKLARGLEMLGVPEDDTLPYLLHLLGRAPASVRTLDAEILGLGTRRALQAMLEARSRLSPTVLIVEDLHWIDTASEEYLEWATEPARSFPLLVVCTHRPVYRPSWAGRANATALPLTALSRASTLELVTSRLGAAGLSPGLQTLVVEKAEGNPLFAEEIATYLQEADAARGAEPALVRDVVLPVSLENLLMERIGRLPEGPRQLLHTAAVIGRRFSLDLVRRVSRLDGAVPQWLRDLERQELVFREADGDEFAFKHALVQDAVYQNLLKARREELHERVADTVEEAHADRLEEVADLLADHYAQTRRADKAVRYVALAGERSLALYSLDAAEARFRQALDLTRAVPGCADDAFLADVLLRIARVYYFRCDFKSLIALVEEYLPRVEALGDKRRLSRFLFETGYAHVFAARQDVGQPLLERALALGEEIGDEESIGYACMGLMWFYIYWAPAGPERRQTLERLGRRALEIGRRLGDVWLTSKGLVALASEAGIWGRMEEALRIDRELLQLSEATGDPRPKAMGLWHMAFWKAVDGQTDAAIEYAEASLRSSLSPMDRLYARLARASALVLGGQPREALAQLEELRQQPERGEMRMVGLLTVDTSYAVALVMCGHWTRGVRWLEAAVERFDAWGQPFARAQGHEYLGRIYLEMVASESRPPLDVVLANLGFAVRAIPFAARRARRHLEAAAEELRRLDIPYHLAEVLLHLGRLHGIKRRYAEARGCFDEARVVAATVDAGALGERIETARASLREGVPT